MLFILSIDTYEVMIGFEKLTWLGRTFEHHSSCIKLKPGYVIIAAPIT